MITLIIIAALFFYAYRTTKKMYARNIEDDEEEPYISSPEPVKQPATMKRYDAKQGTMLTAAEQDIWNSLTSDMSDMPQVEDINYENFDPPIPLKWSTLNPFHKSNKKKN